jgi:hypothetical protein
MRWFNKTKQTEVWEDNQPVGDLEASRTIRNLCNSAASCAEKVGSGAMASNREADRYERAAKKAMEIAIKMSDDLLRDAAVCQIVVLCIRANDLRRATILFRAVQAVSVREHVLTEHPELRQLGA